MAAAEFAINNKVHMATKVLPFMVNYGREMRMGGDIRRKEKVKSVTKFVKRMKKVHEEAEVTLRKTQEEMKRYADRGRKETEEWKKEDRVLLSTKDLVFKERPSKKLMERYVGPYVLRSLMVDFILFSLLLYFSFSFSFIFYFLFLEQLRLGFISHAVTSVTN